MYRDYKSSNNLVISLLCDESVIFLTYFAITTKNNNVAHVDDVAVHAMSLICDDTPKQAIVFDS